MPQGGGLTGAQPAGSARCAFDVTGMTCAACSARVAKAANGVPGVGEAAVNLLKNSMEIRYDGDPATLAAVSAAVGKAGYGATPRPDPAQDGDANHAGRAPMPRISDTARKAAGEIRRRLVISAAFTIPLSYLGMENIVTRDEETILNADKLILPEAVKVLQMKA